ncbi:MAG: YitT family protein, partial [Desulfobacterales bacterium]|nr:YitT family protein [Desulfobacterales bacterium]
IEGQGAFSGQEQHILYTVITFRELSRLKTLVRAMDPNAFVVVSDTLEVMGKRVGNQPHW